MVVPTSSATVAIETFMTELSSVITNCADASVSSTSMLPARTAAELVTSAPSTAERYAAGWTSPSD